MKASGIFVAATIIVALTASAGAGEASDAGAADGGAPAHGFVGTWKLTRKTLNENLLTFGANYAVTLVVDAKGATWTEAAGGSAPLWGQQGYGQPKSPTCTDTIRGLRIAVDDDAGRLDVTSGPATREACSPGPRCTATFLTYSGMFMVSRRMTCDGQQAKGMHLVFERRGPNTMATRAEDGSDAVLIYERAEAPTQ